MARTLVFKPLIAGILMSLLTLSCTSLPKQVNLERAKISQFSSVAVGVTASDLEVKYQRADSVIWPIPMDMLLLSSLIYAIDSSIDQTYGKSVRQGMEQRELKDVLGSCFVDKVKQSNLFQKIEYFHDLPHDFSEKTIGEGYDAIIRIYLKDVSLIRVAGEKLELFIDARATMTSLVSEETVWSRQETQMTNERFSLEFLESHGDEVRKIFYQMIENLGERLANEFLYVK